MRETNSRPVRRLGQGMPTGFSLVPFPYISRASEHGRVSFASLSGEQTHFKVANNLGSLEAVVASPLCHLGQISGLQNAFLLSTWGFTRHSFQGSYASD